MDTTMTNWSSRPSGATTRGPEKTPSSEQLPDVPVAQRVFAVLAIVATLPYIVLKIMWLAGSRVGLNDPDFGTDLTMRVLNALTGALDVVALALAVTFLTRRGFRAPAILVLPPMWAGAGLLGTILVTLPVQLVIGAFSSPAAPTGAIPPIADWVFTMVYGGFTLLGIGLLGAFGVYAWQRCSSRHLPFGERRSPWLAPSWPSNYPPRPTTPRSPGGCGASSGRAPSSSSADCRCSPCSR
jgi:hypothetical protein